uniref:Rap-GAP domain-containing protein n=1 Tax=Ciona savignyi TaxID=51511 RepID=H2Z705_CIOSA
KIHRQPQGEGAVKKSIQKLLDPKKDVVTRLKHLKNIIENSTIFEIQSLFQLHYSHIYFVFFENFLLAETNLRLKGSHRAQREELDAILAIFEQILINLPELVHQRWQYHSIDTVIKRLLHSQNSLKVRREGIHFFLLWLRALRGNSLSKTLLLYSCLVPGFPLPTSADGKQYSLEYLLNMPVNEEFHQVEIMCLVPPPSGEKVPLDLTKYFLDSLLEFMVLKSEALRWKNDRMETECFSFLWDLFKEYYLPHAFTDFNFNTSIYNTTLCLPEPRESVNYVLNVSDSGSIDPRIEVASGCSMLQARVSIIKWIVAFTGRFEKSATPIVMEGGKEGNDSKPTTPSGLTPQHLSVTSVQTLGNEPNSNTSTLTEKEPSISSVSSLDDKLKSSGSAEEELVRSVLYSTRQNVNIVHEMFRQTFMLPLTEVPTMRRVVKVYQEWIQDGDIPVFMEEIPDHEQPETEDINSDDENDEKEKLTRQKSTNSLRNVSYMRGQLNPVIDRALNSNVRAGGQTTLQLFITNSAHIFLVEPPRNAPKLVQAQVDVCKRVLNLYRYMVMNVFLSEVTWQQLLRVLLHITRVMLQEATFDDPGIHKYETVAGRLAGPVFQTLIVSWIKANLFRQVSRELWDELVDVLSSLTNWEELITEWAKNMETMTRVLARHVYKLDLQDLPLDRLTEQKHKKQRRTGPNFDPSSRSERSFSRGWSQDSTAATSDMEASKTPSSQKDEQISEDASSLLPPTPMGRPRSSTRDDMFEMLAHERLHPECNTNLTGSTEVILFTHVIGVNRYSSENLNLDLPPNSRQNVSINGFQSKFLIYTLRKAVSLILSPGVGKVQSHSFPSEDAVTDPPNYPTSPPAIPARVALPSNVNLFDINYLTQNSPASSFKDISPNQPPEINLIPNSPLYFTTSPSPYKYPHPSHESPEVTPTAHTCPEVTPPPHTCTTNVTPSNPGELTSYVHTGKSSASSSPGRELNSESMDPIQQQAEWIDENLVISNLQHKKLISGMQNGLDSCSIMAGGKKSGWFPDVAVALWRRLLGIMDINKIEDGLVHELVFDYLLELWGIMFRMRQNIGIVNENQQIEETELVPPLRILAPWGFKATMVANEQHKGGRLHAYELLCKMTLQREHDTPLEPGHLSQFYAVLHHGLHSTDEDVVNEIVRSSSNYFPSTLDASTLLLLDFIYAFNNTPPTQAPRVEAQTILGSTLCFPNLYHDIPVLKPDVADPTTTICSNVKDYVVEALLTSGKKEPSAAARCVALSSTGVWLYEELTTSHTRHSRVKEAINVLLVSLKFSNRTVASVACTQLHLLTHCSTELMENMPEMPPRIIEVMSLTVSALLNGTEAKNTDSGRQLLVSLLLCILDWCMAVPLELLTDTYGAESDKRLIRTVFKALQTAALGKPGHSAKHSYSLSDLASQDFDPNLQLEKVQEAPGFVNRSKLNSVNRSNTVQLGRDGAVSLAAHTVLSHLTNHLGHFPLARGCSLLACRVSEHQDVEDAPGELSSKLFNSPNVQFLIYNDTCLMSVVEIPAETSKPGGGAADDMLSSNRCVRFIMRDGGGKYCWDWSLLYSPSAAQDANKPVHCEPLSTLDDEIGHSANAHCQAYMDYSSQEEGRRSTVVPTELPVHSQPQPDGTDKLDSLLQYIGWSSPECQSRGCPLNTHSPPPPPVLPPDVQSNAITRILQHHTQLGASYYLHSTILSATKYFHSWQSKAIAPEPAVKSPPPFHLARLVCAQMGFLSRDNRHRVHLLKKNERFLRELKNLDSRHCRETHKVAVLYIAPGQEDKLSVLSNTGGSKEYEDFVAGLGWEVDLRSHCGFRGKLQSDGSAGVSAPYYATSTLEVVFHVATRFPSTDDSARNVKLKHLGNDEVHIVWSEHSRDYRRGIIPTEFGDVVIVIYPIRHGLYRVQIIKKPDVPYFGPLFDGAIVNSRVLPVLVRETAINAGRAKRSQIPLYQPFYEERTRYLRQIINQFKDDRTFEEYSAHLFSPVP